MSEKTKRARGRPRTIDREEAITDAMRSWWAEGAKSLSLNEISRRTRLSKSSLYREFGGEDGLMAAALARYRTLAVVPLLELFERPLEPAQTLALLVKATTSDRGLPPGCFFTKLRLTHTSLGDATSEALQAMIEERLAAFAAWYTRVIETDHHNPALGPDQAAGYLDAQLSLLLVRLAAGDPIEEIRADAALALGVLLR